MTPRRRTQKSDRPTRWWRRKTAVIDESLPVDTRRDLLVISDMHLGEDCKPKRNLFSLRRLLRMEANLVAFLDHHRIHRSAGRPWRLVINGDMIDFPHVHLASEVNEANSDLRRFGRGSNPGGSVAKLDRVVGRHAAFFEALARFVSAGHHVEIVCGNHDIELHWPCVQTAFRLHLACQSGEAPSSWRDADSRVTFHDWFYLEPGRIYIEHGHQYDATSSWEHFLDPRTSGSGKEIVLNLSSAMIRYFANLEPAMDPHGQHRWTPLRYVRWAFREGPSGTWRIFLRFVGLATRLVELWRLQAGVHRDAVLKKLHGDRLVAIARRVGVDVETLRTLDGFRRRPVTWSLLSVAQILYFDRIGIWLAAGLLGVVLPTIGLLDWSWGLLMILPIAVAIDHALSLGRNLNPGKGLQLAAARIRDLVEVPVVAFGHTHDPIQVELDGGWYFNTGTWLDGQDAGDGVPFTYLCVRQQDDAIDASLLQWGAAGSRGEGLGPVRIPMPPAGIRYIA